MSPALLIVNAGSSSIRCALYEQASLATLARVHVEAIGAPDQRATWSGALAGDWTDTPGANGSVHATVIAWLLATLVRRLPDIRIAAVGHRVVHGGRDFDRAVLIDATVERAIAQLAPLAPHHQPHNLAAIRAVRALWPHVPQVACFDTAFHRSQPRIAQLLPLPRAMAQEGVLRYGFHGLSYDYLAGELSKHAGDRADGRVIIAHLGHGASMCALLERRSVATTMGFSTLDGLMMGTRCGAIDPGVLLHLLQTGRLKPDELSDLLYNRSGLLGVSAISDDLRVLEASTDPHAREAIDLFAYRAAMEIGALAAALGGLDVLVFSAGIGERSASMRQAICSRCAWLGVALDAAANRVHDSRISTPGSAVDVYVIPTDEELVIGRATRMLLQ
jgi:acetate kinase